MQDVLNLTGTFLKPLFYLACYFLWSHPRIAFSHYYIVMVATVWCTSGIAYFLSVTMDTVMAQVSKLFIVPEYCS